MSILLSEYYYNDNNRCDRGEKEGGLLLYVREDVPSTLLKIDSEIEAFYVKLAIRKKKWLCCSYKWFYWIVIIQSNETFITKHLAVIGRYWDLFSSKYHNFILLADFNSEPCEQRMRDLCHVYNCQRIIKDKTFFKNPHNTSCVELFITNRPKIFKIFKVIETGLSDFHKTSLAVMKIFYKKQRLKILRY